MFGLLNRKVFSAENETGDENFVLFSAETETRKKLVNHFRPKTKPKTKSLFSLIIQFYYININSGSCYNDLIVDVIINSYSTISCSTFIVMSSL